MLALLKRMGYSHITAHGFSPVTVRGSARNCALILLIQVVGNYPGLGATPKLRQYPCPPEG